VISPSPLTIGFDTLGLRLLQLGELVQRPGRGATPASKRFVKLGRQGQQRQMVGNARQVDAHPLGDLGVRFAASTRERMNFARSRGVRP
jgi:hypothetical protein